MLATAKDRSNCIPNAPANALRVVKRHDVIAPVVDRHINFTQNQINDDNFTLVIFLNMGTRCLAGYLTSSDSRPKQLRPVPGLSA